MIKKLGLILCCSVLSAVAAMAQPLCKNYHKDKCTYSKDAFKYNSQSRSALFTAGQVSELRIVVYNGMDYRLALCAEGDIEEELEFQVFDPKTNTVLYDNTEFDYALEVEFSATATKGLIVKITVPEGDDDPEAPESVACIGLMIQHAASLPTGF